MHDATGAAFDPRLFVPAVIDPETAAFNARLAETLASAPPPHTVDPRVIHHAREEGRSIFGLRARSALATGRTLPGPAGHQVGVGTRCRHS